MMMFIIKTDEDYNCLGCWSCVFDSWKNCIRYNKYYSYVQQEFVAAKVLRKRTLSAFIGGNDEEQG